jgi:hypothetical protein
LAAEAGGAKVDVRPVASLLPHEETIPYQTEKLADQMRRDGAQKDPLIVDYETRTILDGMHRLDALKKIGAENVICYLVDYSSKSISLERWVRVYEASGDRNKQRLLEGLELDQRVRLSEVFDIVEKKKNSCAILTSSSCYVPRKSAPDLATALSFVRKVDGVAKSLRWRTAFVAEDEIDVALQDPSSILVLTPRLTKQDVIDAARSGRLFPWKTTKHVVDPRPVGVKFPLFELMKPSPPRHVLEEMLKERKGTLLPPNSFYEGRRYKESLLFLGGQ